MREIADLQPCTPRLVSRELWWGGYLMVLSERETHSEKCRS